MRDMIKRQIYLPLGTTIGLIGDYNAESSWGKDTILNCELTSYTLIERKSLSINLRNDFDDNPEVVWDTAVLAICHTTLNIIGIDRQSYTGANLLIFHRYIDTHWNNSDPNVHVFGIKNVRLFTVEPTPYQVWLKNAVWLSAAAIMIAQDDDNQSEMSRVLKEKYKTSDT
ncbi:MAG: hypothetical protein OHK0046_15820 [Anaerolineae bacterium]